MEDILTLQELKFYFKYNQGILPIYLQNWNFISNSKIHNHNTRKIRTLHTFKTKHEFAKKWLKYNLPYTINNIPHIVKDKVNTHSFQGFSLYVKNISLVNITQTAYHGIATYAVFCPGLKKGTVLLEGKGHFRARNYILRALLRAELHFEGTFVHGIVTRRKKL